jgi:uncharacterized damage-inducible protein DinB
MHDNIKMFANYNKWANERLFTAAAGLSDAQYRADKGAYFGSMHGTLNHLLVGDRAWMQRFTDMDVPIAGLDKILHDDFEDLRTARITEDDRIIGYIDALTQRDLAGDIHYKTIVNPQDVTQGLAQALAHFFNHQTHHRGQAHCLLTILTGNAPPLDLVYFQRGV